jgi:RimJ/RimL family protein N-acetyltransferase
LAVPVPSGHARIAAIAIHTLLTDDRWRDGLPVLEGNLVSLREVAYTDAPSLYVLVGSDPKVAEHISAPPASVNAFHGFITWAHRQRAAGKLVCYAIVPKGLQHAVGLFQIRKQQPNFFVAEWGFVLGSSFWGTGIFEDAAVLVADFAFDTLGAHRLEARAVTTNARGNGALNKLGAKGEAILRAGLKRDNLLLTQYLWTLRSVDWHDRRSVIRNRFSTVTVEKEIQDAITEARQLLAAAAPPAASADVPSHPFFITDKPDSPDE